MRFKCCVKQEIQVYELFKGRKKLVGSTVFETLYSDYMGGGAAEVVCLQLTDVSPQPVQMTRHT